MTLRGTNAFRIVVAATVSFFLLTLAAMAVYSGGRLGAIDARGYSFFANFFSDLGQTRTHSGDANLPSLILFCAALGSTAVGLVIFFVAFARLFSAPRGRRFATVAAVCGCVTAVSFVGVACTPWNLYLQAHNDFVMWAFRSFLVAALLDATAVLVTPGFPRRFATVFGAFAVLLAVYVGLLVFGPRLTTPGGALVQATGQKIIVYASVLTILVQAAGAQSMLRSPTAATHSSSPGRPGRLEAQ